MNEHMHHSSGLYERLCSKLGYEFKDTTLLKTALTHSSYSNESKTKADCNERLEFLGDSVLGLSVSEYVYKTFPHLPEGSLTKLRAGVVSETTLANAARDLGLGEFLLLGRGEQISGGRDRDSILADAMEAVIGAIYLDGGFERARDFVLKQLRPAIERHSTNNGQWDSKTQLQELLQSKSATDITYEIIDERGPDHNKQFTAQVSSNGKVIGVGTGKSKKEAEQNAAHEALRKLTT
ncbi:MAG TPA: ribonuclease III [Candidatus Atribacteria bacterium]|nr:ribonuclease III [Candidatus Atribacteria bacterium]